MHLLFWLSLVPFASGWMGENNFATVPVAVSGFILTMCALAYHLLATTLIYLHGRKSTIYEALGKDRKGTLSLVLYILASSYHFLMPGLVLPCMYW